MTRRLLLLACLGCVASAQAVPVEKWVQTTQSDFEQAEASGTAVLGLGQVVLAPEFEPLLDKPVTHIWALAADAKGTVYAASGIAPRLLRIRGGKVETAFTSPDKGDIEVLSVAVGPAGAVYAATAPSGTIYRIPAEGKPEPFYKGSDPYVWAMAVAPDGTVYAATGPNGKLLKIAASGKAATLLKANADHILSLLLAPDGSLYAGTDKNGYLYHVSPKGKARVAYDADESDIRALALGPDGELYIATAATAAAAGSAPTKPSTSAPAGGRTIIISRRPSAMAAKPSPGSSRGSTSSRPSKPSAPGARLSATNTIYRLAPSGDVTKVLSVQGVAFHALAWHQGQLFAATGNDGKLYRVNGDRAVQLADLDESQITALAVADGRLVLATANPGRIYRVTARHTSEGTLVSEVYDTGTLSHWGQLSWVADAPRGTSVAIAVRTGNVAKPDATWSDWSSDHREPAGAAIGGPPARFIQYRATLKTSKGDATPTLDEVVIAYVQSNRPPTVAEVKVGRVPEPRRPQPRPQPGAPAPPQPTPESRPLTTKKQPASPQRGPFPDHIRILWKAEDPNKDNLLYDVYFRGEGETTWKRLAERLGVPYHDWDTHNVPDGAYRVRVVASDAASNPPAQALTGERITEAFTIDNTPPAISELKTQVHPDRTVTVIAPCTDKGSTLASAEYSIDAGDWTNVPAADGIFDSAAETVRFTTKPLDKGEHTLVLRAKDDAENSGAAKAVFVVK